MKLVNRTKYNQHKSLLRFSVAYGLHVPRGTFLGTYSGDWIFDDLEDKMLDIFDRLPEGLS